ncbi:MAG TPA: FN3 domain-containing metallophosphoesterase family protein [Bacteroidales bacterium]|jgi:predicted MPP superfamily phosphohydrolase|nr:FN3 domain-containing metallophosphoesterase family protein [Bacteroidales bacterium]HOS70877.1 FN3 domain-containing metallophosphoesterase family protein [Bacteroidales bacterium]HQH25439.1 FN3 domain-containing metallophosphoesterase family protein [Bacteroidales bacterium]HQJ82994.1 FN3 domain-containing metallophosphoesterase family protein [Bacteroidales bacterium]
MKKLLIILLLLPAYCQTLPAQEQAFKITHGPYLTDMSETAVTIVWITNKNALAWVEVAPDDGSHFYGKERPRYYDTYLGRRQAATTLHRVRIENLTPGTRYRYGIFSKEVLHWENDARIVYGTTIANPAYSRNSLSFKTFSSSDDTVSFIMLNDIHGRADFMKELCRDIDFNTIDLVVFNGDMSSAIHSEEQIFSDFMDAAVDLFAKRVPIAFTRGNHETRGPYADYLMYYFPLKGEKIYRTFNVGNVAFIMLDCGEDKPDSDIEYSGLADFDAYRNEQAAWLRQAVLEKSFRDTRNKIVILHMPPGVSDWHGTLHIDEVLVPLLNEAGTDAVLSGHTHRYSFHPPVQGKTAFPVVVNSNNTYLRGDVVNGKIRIRMTGTAGTKPIEHILE